MIEKEEFRDLLAEVVAGSNDASSRFLQRFGPELLRAVRRRLPQQLRPQFDSLDFVQDVWASYFAAESMREFRDPEECIAFLTRVAQNKVIDAVRSRMKSRKRNVNLERPLPNNSAAVAAIPQLADTETPSVAVMNDEEWQKILEAQPPVYRQVLILLRQGKHIREVALSLGLNEKTVYRVIARISDRIALANNEW